ncbi:hypothetical protein [Planctomonas deserti]|uniref:hypothetical protein n=1 Tax=Planctomonas deserti TaxID=2144185 RepID=UPI00131EE0E0|nr:hypothetical protein [Planctomonas deserti]
MTAKDRLIGKPRTSRRLALFSTIGGGVVMLLALGLAVVAFNQPASWLPPLLVTQPPFWLGVRTLRDQQRRKRGEASPKA